MAINLTDLESQGPAEVIFLRALRAAATLWLDLRRDVLCELSCEDGEWMDSDDSLAAIAEKLGTMRVLAERIHHYADSLVSEDKEQDLIWTVLTEQAKLGEHVIRVPWDDDSATQSAE